MSERDKGSEGQILVHHPLIDDDILTTGFVQSCPQAQLYNEKPHLIVHEAYSVIFALYMHTV